MIHWPLGASVLPNSGCGHRRSLSPETGLYDSGAGYNRLGGDP
ncbi:MAG TPA: hypothetical protein ACN46R_07905 [Prochlorococcus sp.]